MCMNCGCGQLDTRHKDSDIVREDIQRAAKGQTSSVDETIRNLESSLGRMRSESGGVGSMAGSSSGASSRTR